MKSSDSGFFEILCLMLLMFVYLMAKILKFEL